MYGLLLAREVADWLVRFGECELRNDGGIDMIRLARKTAARAADKSKMGKVAAEHPKSHRDSATGSSNKQGMKRTDALKGKDAKTPREKVKPSGAARGSRKPARDRSPAPSQYQG
jgi:hypothetical protein